ncbi:hypothetical protein [Aquabacterium sp.]|uniref:hypothetical protein n=1 Tax=Aquabacterium sp. TaxID=1872578 RepID=UPI003783C212
MRLHRSRAMGLLLAVAGALGLLGPLPARAQAPAGLIPFSEPADSGSIEIDLGSRYTGPGILTVGRLGTKKQVVLPAGDWVVLAAFDYRISDADMSALALGRFDGNQLRSVLRFVFNRNVTPVQNWAEFDACAREDAQALLQTANLASATRNDCQRVKAHAAAALNAGHDGPLIQQSLQRLGAQVPAGPVIVSTQVLAERRYGMLQVQRTDWLAPVLGAQAGQPGDWRADALPAAPERARYAKALLDWGQRYRQATMAGFERRHRDDDLEAGRPPARDAALLALGDFEPLSR